MSFNVAIAQFMAERVNPVALNILVWGNAEAENESYRKRSQIRETLSKEFPNADVRFSEELDQQSRDALGDDGSLAAQYLETLQLGACDLCVVLDTSAGAAAEIARFSGTVFRGKLFVLSHEQYRDAESFPAEIRKDVEVDYYTTAEFEACSVVAKAVSRAKVVALQRVAYGSR
jgi:hypothetical protein